jgi:hypothetical protein
MEIPTQLRCLFGGGVEQRNGTCLIEVLQREMDLDNLQQGETFRVAVFGYQLSTTLMGLPPTHSVSGRLARHLLRNVAIAMLQNHSTKPRSSTNCGKHSDAHSARGSQ